MGEPRSYPFDCHQHRQNGDWAISLRNQDKHAQAANLLRINLAMSSRYFKADDLTVLNDRDSLSDCLRELGDYEGAIKLDEVTLPIRQKIDAEAEDTIATLQSLADNLRQIGKLDKAIPLYRSALSTRVKTLGWKHNDTLDTRHNLANSLYDCGQVREACELNAQLLKIREERLAADDDDLIATRHNLAMNYYDLGYLQQAAELTNQNLRALKNTGVSTDDQSQAARRLQEIINFTIRKEKRAEAIRAKKQAEGASSQAPKTSSNTKGQAKAPKEVDAKDAKDSKAESPARTGTNRSEVKIQRVNVDNFKVKAGVRMGQHDREAGMSKQQANAMPYSRTSGVGAVGAGADLKLRDDKREATAMRKEADPTAMDGRADANVSWPEAEARVKNDSPKFGTPRSGLEVRTRFDQHATDPFKAGSKVTSLKQDTAITKTTGSRGGDSLKPEVDIRARKSGKDTETYQNFAGGNTTPVAPTSSSSSRKEAEMMPGLGQGLQRGRVPFQVNEARPHSSQSTVETRARPKSSDERVASSSKLRTLSTPTIDEPRSKSVGAISEEQKSVDRGAHTFSQLCDARKGHGTHCAALLLDLSPNADIYVARVTEEGRNNVNPEAVTRAILHAANEWKVAIISMSFGWPQHHSAVRDAIDHATTRGVLICAAAANGGANAGVAFPANCSPVICVHSTNEDGKPSKFTPNPLQYIPNFAVLGENVQSLGHAHGPTQTGTSTATPILAAVMALILEFVDQKPRKTPDEKRLQDHRVMTKVLLAMSDEVGGYRHVRPWKIMSYEAGRGRVESRILDAIES
ncbi:MAG: hypothetical protein Q9201_003583 [Fulgogasparrea decipioides]